MMAWSISRAINTPSWSVKRPISRDRGEERGGSADRAGPGRLVHQRDGRRVARGKNLDEVLAGVLPLEHEGVRGAVLAKVVELHLALHGVQRDAAVQVLDDPRVADA